MVRTGAGEVDRDAAHAHLDPRPDLEQAHADGPTGRLIPPDGFQFIDFE